MIIMAWNAHAFQWEFQESAWRGCRSIPAEEICWDTPQSSPNFTMKKWQNWGYPHVFPFFLTPKLSIAVLVVCEIVVKPSRPSSKFPDLAKLWTNISKFPVIPEIWASWRKDGPQRRSRNLCLGEGSDRFLHQGKYDVLFLVVSISKHQTVISFTCFFHVFFTCFWADEIQLKNTCKIHLEPGAATFTVALKVVKVTYLAWQKSLQDVENTGIGHGSKSRIEQN